MVEVEGVEPSSMVAHIESSHPLKASGLPAWVMDSMSDSILFTLAT